MMLIAILAVVALAGVVALSRRQLARRRDPEELRGDWWGRFEQEFWAYERQRQHPRDQRQEAPVRRSSSPREHR